MAKFVDENLENPTASYASKYSLKLTNPEYYKRALTFKPHPRDVIICSYPKCDSKAIEIIVWKLLYPSALLPQRNYFSNRYLETLEAHGVPDEPGQRRSTRLLKTHLPFQLVSFYKRAKYIYVVRTPWKACVAYYKFLNANQRFDDSFDRFFKLFLLGDLEYGCYFKHVLSWTKKAEESNILILCHEHVKHNPRSAISTIAAFLGDCYLKKVLHSNDLQDDILKAMQWEKFKPSQLYVKKQPDEEERDLTCSEKQVDELLVKMFKEAKGNCVEHLWLNLLKK